MGWVSFEELLDDIIALDTAHTLLQDKQSYVGIHDQSQLNAEVERIYPYLKDLCGIYADIPGKATFQGGLEEKIWARLGGKGRSFNADPSSYHIGIGKLVKQTGIATARLHSKLRSPDSEERRVHGVLSHELAHCASSNESATQLRGIEINARMGLNGFHDHHLEAYRRTGSLVRTSVAVKAILEEREDELLALTEKNQGKRWKEKLSQEISFQKKRASNGDFYKALIYFVLPYKALRHAVDSNLTAVKVPDAPPFSREDFFPSLYESLRGVLHVPTEDPILVPATLELYQRARDN